MKYILIIGDGMADKPLNALSGKTPLETAKKPEIDRLSKTGVIGTARTVPEGFPPGSDTAIMSIFGCSPLKYYSGRAPIEAAAQGIALNPGDAAMRCNNITLSGYSGERKTANENANENADMDANASENADANVNENTNKNENTDAAERGDAPLAFGEKLLLSHCGGNIEGGEANELVRWLFSHPEFTPLLKKLSMELFPTVSYRHIAVMRGVNITGLTSCPPHDHLQETVDTVCPRVADGIDSATACTCTETLYKLLQKANELLEAHPINTERVKNGLLPANGIWFWAEGTAAKLQNFTDAYGKTGAVISAVPLCHGIATLVGLDVVKVDGATGEVDTNYAGKVAAALDALKTRDFVCVHLEGADECTHCGDLPGKITAIERLSELVIKPLTTSLTALGKDFRMLILSDHYTLMEERGMHDGTPVPYLLYDSRGTNNASNLPYTERCAAAGEYIGDATKLIERLFAE